MAKKINRRDLISSASSLAGYYSASSILGQNAFSQTGNKKEAIVYIHCRGGYSGRWASPLPFLNRAFGGVTDNTLLPLGNGLTVASAFSMLPKYALDHMATAGVRHLRSNHRGAAEISFQRTDNHTSAHVLAEAMGGSGTTKLVVAGGGNPTRTDTIQRYRDVSGQAITDMKAAIDSLAPVPQDNVYRPDRPSAARGVETALNLSNRFINGNPLSLASLSNSYPVAVETLKKPVQAFDAAETFLAAYKLNSTEVLNDDDFNVASHLALAEIMIRQGTNIVLSQCRGPWDNHDNPNQSEVIPHMENEVIPHLATFCRRVYGDPSTNLAPAAGMEQFNVTIVLGGDFLRSGPDSGHGSGNALTIIGPKIQNGITAAVSNQGVITNDNTPGPNGLWGLLAEIVGAPQARNQMTNDSSRGTLGDWQFHRSLLRPGA